MDYLDPKKQFRHNIMLMVGYVLIGVGILIATVILLQVAYGYARGKDGQIIQNGFVFVSSQPHPAQIYTNGQLNKAKTNTRLTLQAGQYTLQLKRSGYRDWQRTITVLGGDLQHFDYPLLIPTTLSSTKVKAYDAAPLLSTQSPDHRWLLVQPDPVAAVFDLYDLKDPSKVSPTTLTVPASLISKSSGDQSWQAVEWSNDNTHVLLQHNTADKVEFVVLDRQSPDQSVNLATVLSATPTAVSLNNKKYDQYYLYNAADHTLLTASLRTPAPAPYLEHVLAYKSYSDNTVLYVTDADAPAGKVLVKMRVGDKTYALRELATGSSYIADLTQYSGDLYVLTGSSSDNRVYIYKDPINQLDSNSKRPAIALRVLRIAQPNFGSFSANTQFIMAENAANVAVYDIENNKAYAYALSTPLDAPQAHLAWMDGDRLVYVSQGKLVILDYDNTNRQELVSSLPGYAPAFAPDFKYVYSLGPNAQ
ncbi:MAG TPA: PEGA domain-containing protein, partial [Candidatus Saccharimonadales bacterium]|nr:PEGA domain-containing protein [Candidatus Saccharimonadales bacterium]